MTKDQKIGIVYILLTSTGYAFFFVFTRQLTLNNLPPLDIATWRFVIAVPLMWLFVLFRRVPTPDKPLPVRSLLLLGPVMTVAALCAFFGLQYIPAAVYSMIYYSYPALVAVISVLRGERLELLDWTALAVTMIGVALTVPDLSQGLQQGGNVLGVGLALLNAVVVAVYFVVIGKLLRGHGDMPRASAWSTTGTFLPLLILAPFRNVTLPANLTTWANLFGLAIFSTVLPVILLNLGIQKLGAVRAAVLSTIEPVLTLLLAVLLLGNILTPIQLVGGALILSSGILIQLRQPTRIGEPAPAEAEKSTAQLR